MKQFLFKILIFILRPFAVPVRYGALKLMKAMHRQDDKRPIIVTAEHLLDEKVLPSVFLTFQEKKFRELANFAKLPVSEHDRIFNELQIAGLCLADNYLDTAKNFVKDGDFHFWRDVREELPRRHVKKFISMGVDSGNAKLMRQLMEMRYKEYNNIAEDVLRASNEQKTEFRELRPEMKSLGSFIQAVAIGTADHIKRGKLEKEDPLIKFLVEWLLALQKKVGKFVKNL